MRRRHRPASQHTHDVQHQLDRRVAVIDQRRVNLARRYAVVREPADQVDDLAADYLQDGRAKQLAADIDQTGHQHAFDFHYQLTCIHALLPAFNRA